MLSFKKQFMSLFVVVVCIFLLVTQCDCKRSQNREQHKRRNRGRQNHSSRSARSKAANVFQEQNRSVSKEPENSVTGETTVEPIASETTDLLEQLELTTFEDDTTTTETSTIRISTTASATLKLKESDFTKEEEETETSPARTLSPNTISPRKNKTVIIKTGKIRGKVEQLSTGRVYSYLGIPYGEAPIGENRFKPSQPKKAWNGTKDALEYASTCHQWKDNTFNWFQKGFRGTAMWNPNTPVSEDCLYLNVWTPTNPRQSKTNKLTVMVWIYGGGFYSGTSSLDVYNGKWLASTQKVVVVSMNYRIGALGFLATGSPEIPGNAGLFDQRLALQWVQDNIHSFGGDRKRVTVFGESAGAASIALHLMSEGSKGLFRNAILESASAFSPWAVLSKKESIRRAKNLAKTFHCVDSPSNGSQTDELLEFSPKIVSCLRQVDPQKLVKTEMGLESWGTAGFPNAAFVDGDFLKSSPHEITNETYFNNDVNIMAGFNANEGNYFLVYGSPGFNLSESKIGEEDFNSGVDIALRSLKGVKETNPYIQNVLNSLSNFVYTGGRRPSLFEEREQKHGDRFLRKDTRYSLHNDKRNQEKMFSSRETFYRDRLDDMVGDINFVCPTIDFLGFFLQQQRTNKVQERRKKAAYLYKFVHRSSQNPWPEWLGVMHGYEIEFIFGLPLDANLNYTDAERNISHAMMKMWANFARFNNPNGRQVKDRVVWSSYNEMSKYIYVFGDEKGQSTTSKSSLHSSKYSSQLTHCVFWREQFPEMRQRLETLPQPRTCPAVAPPSGSAHATVGVGIYLLLTFLPGVFLNWL